MVARARKSTKSADARAPRKPRPSEVVKRLVWTRAAAQCAFPGCHRELIEEAVGNDPAVFLGEIAHIVGHSEDGGPRADQPIPGGDRESEANLILLCLEHHAIIDGQEGTYTVERLVALKAEHERWVRELHRGRRPLTPSDAVAERLHSTLLAVEQIPRYVYAAPCLLAEKDIRGRIRYPVDKRIFVPAIVREKKLLAFADLRDAHGPFADVVAEPEATERHEVGAWLRDEDLGRWVVDLLNRAIGRFMALRGLRYDREHHRYYFAPESDAEGKPADRTVSYRPMNQGMSQRKAAWNPIRRSTGEHKSYWIHLAVGLRFHRVSPGQWVVSIRPEHRFTRDGTTPLASKGVGKKSTSAKSRLYNSELLTEVHFWRDYLAESKPKLILDLAGQSLVLDAMLMQSEVRWPGVPDDVVPFQNVEAEDDLFTSAEYFRALEDGLQQDVELDEHELDELDHLVDLGARVEDGGDDAMSDEDFNDATADEEAVE